MNRSSPRVLAASLLALTLTVCTPSGQPPPPAAPPAAAPAAKPAAFDENAVASYYRGKTIRIVVGVSPGGQFDQFSRLLARHISRYIPGEPPVIVENKPGAGTMLAANAVYNAEPKDGTVIAHINSSLAPQQAIGAEGIQFDVGKFNWLGSAQKRPQVCVARTELGIQSIQELIEGRKEVVVGTSGPGSDIHDTPAALKEALGLNFKIVSGYGGLNPIVLAFEGKEVDGFCGGLNFMTSQVPHLLEGENPSAKAIIVSGAQTPDYPFLKGVPAAEPLAKTEEVKQLLRAVDAPNQVAFPWAVAPEVPQDRVEALRKAVAAVFADPQFQAEASRAALELTPSTGDEVARQLQAVVHAQPAVVTKLKQLLKQ